MTEDLLSYFFKVACREKIQFLPVLGPSNEGARGCGREILWVARIWRSVSSVGRRARRLKTRVACLRRAS